MPQSVTEIESRLAAVRAAIDKAIASGTISQSISGGGGSRSFTRYSLNDLYKLEKELEARLGRAKNGWRTYASFSSEAHRQRTE